MMNKGLFTFGILAYNNYKYIFETVDALLNQTYSAIELIITNDGSADFNKEELTEYIEIHKGDNIKRVVINNNEKNIGTVRSANYVCKEASGEFIMLMAADDVLFDREVISKYVDCMKAREDIQILCSSVAMCDTTLKEVHNTVPSEEEIELIKASDSCRMYSRLSYEGFMPTTSTCFRYTALEETGFFDETYFLIEDAPKFACLVRRGYKFGWIEMVATKHRDGGVSHGNERNHSESYRRYRYDEMVYYINEILPNRNLISSDEILKMKKKWGWIKSNYYSAFILSEDGGYDFREYDQEICKKLMLEFKTTFYRRKVIQWLKVRGTSISLKNSLANLLLVFVLGYVLRINGVTSVKEIFIDGNIWNILSFGGGVVLACISALDISISILFKIYRLIYRLIFKNKH